MTVYAMNLIIQQFLFYAKYYLVVKLTPTENADLGYFNT